MKKLLLGAAVVNLFVFFSCKGNDKPEEPQENPNAPKIMTYSIVNTFPHDTSSYTQGLLIYKGQLYEGTGNYGFSKLLKVDLATGKALQQISLDKKFFGEGVTILNDTVYQLTWKEKTVFVYSLKDFREIKRFSINTDGWGLTNDGKNLIVSDGSSELYYYDPATFKLLKTQTVMESSTATSSINEMEFINGFIYANQYQMPYILKIDPNTGMVVAKADVSDMWQRIRSIDPDADVPNGIAYDQDSKKIYITGKWWPQLFEVQFSN